MIALENINKYINIFSYKEYDLPVIKKIKCEEVSKWYKLRKVEHFTIHFNGIKTFSTGYSKTTIFSFNGFLAVTTNG